MRSILALTTLIALAGCSQPSSRSGQKIARISNKDFTEQRILSAMFRITLEAQGFRVVDEATPGLSTADVRNALIEAEIDLYPEYTGTALETLFTPPESDPLV